jgi:undecaprenyl-diphosphatase
MRLPWFLKRLEVTTTATLAGAGAAIWLFLALSDEVSENETAPIDQAVILAMRVPGHPSDPIGPPMFEEAVRDVTALGGTTVLILVAVMACLGLLYFRKRREAAVFLATVLSAEIVSEGLKLVFSRPRPNLVPHGAYVYSHSFPSGHSLLSAATFLTLAAILSATQSQRRFKVFVFTMAILLTAAIGLSRVYLGVHWPSDVLGGWTLGAAFALVARLLLGWWKTPGRPEIP